MTAINQCCSRIYDGFTENKEKISATTVAVLACFILMQMVMLCIGHYSSALVIDMHLFTPIAVSLSAVTVIAALASRILVGRMRT